MRYLTLLLFILSFIQNGRSADSLRVNVNITHLSGDSLGKISIQVAGGNPPYIYKWRDGSEQSSRTGLYRGEYVVNISDAANRISVKKINLLYTQLPLLSNDSVLNPNDTLRRILYKNTLDRGQNGHIDLIVNDLNGEKTFAFSSDTVHAVPSHGFFINRNKLFLLLDQRISGNFGKVKKGDLLRIRKEGDRVSFFMNGVELSAARIEDRRFHSVLQTKKAVVDKDKILSSFNIPLVVETTITDSNCDTGAKGFLTVNIKGGVAPFSTKIYKGYEASESRLLGDRSFDPGPYLTVVTDLDGNLASRKSNIANKHNWRASSEFLSDPLNVKKSASDGWCNSRLVPAAPVNVNGDGWVEFQTGDTSSSIFFGLFPNATSSSAPVTQGLFISNRQLYSVQIDQDGGFQKDSITNITASSRIRIQLLGEQVNYLVDDTILLTLNTVVLPPLKVEARLFNSGGTISQIRTSYSCQQ